jgi:rhodanese-related sulfurtransferase
MPLNHHVSDLVLSARSQIDKANVHDALRMQEHGEARLTDIRDVGELKQNGTVTGSYHAPRGMLEFWVDPLSPYHKIVFSTDLKLILFYASGMLSALATKTLMDMGMKNVMDMEGGFTEWRMQQLAIGRPT